MKVAKGGKKGGEWKRKTLVVCLQSSIEMDESTVPVFSFGH